MNNVKRLLEDMKADTDVELGGDTRFPVTTAALLIFIDLLSEAIDKDEKENK